jgi:hypothetical protein
MRPYRCDLIGVVSFVSLQEAVKQANSSAADILSASLKAAKDTPSTSVLANLLPIGVSLKFTLKVTNSHGLAKVDEFEVKVENVKVVPKVTIAGPTERIASRMGTINLEGEASVDATCVGTERKISYQWEVW